MSGADLRFEQVYEDYQDKLLRYLTGMVGPAEAEDLTQEVFVKISLGLESFRGESSLNTWVYRIAANAAIDLLRRSASRADRCLPVEGGEVFGGDEAFSNGLPASEQRVIKQEMNDCIRQVINNLPEDYRSVIVLSELEDLPDGEIAEILGVSLQTVKIRLHRARARLRQALQNECVFYQDEHGKLACDRR